jgi:hypothetical protein
MFFPSFSELLYPFPTVSSDTFLFGFFPQIFSKFLIIIFLFLFLVRFFLIFKVFCPRNSKFLRLLLSFGSIVPTSFIWNTKLITLTPDIYSNRIGYTWESCPPGLSRARLSPKCASIFHLLPMWRIFHWKKKEKKFHEDNLTNSPYSS